MFFQNSPDIVWSEISSQLPEIGNIVDKQSLSGGSINSAFRIKTDKNRTCFVKLNRESLVDMFEAEAEGLTELRKANAIRVPEPVGFGVGGDYAWFISEFIEFGRGDSRTQALFGRQFAQMHRLTAKRFGWHRNNTIGSTLQVNDWADDWIAFFREQRLGFQLELAARNGFTGSIQKKGERLLADLRSFFGPYRPAASIMHGDLWGGNHGVDRDGKPVIFDPAVYYGDREADLAMTSLFGGCSAAFYDAYDEAWPLDVGYRQRKTLYNLYHILNHANLFGGGYAMQAEGMMDQLLAEIR